MNFETLVYEEIEAGRVGLLKISRPKALNALNGQVISELETFFSGVKDLGVRCLILTGDGEKSFVAGADIKEMEGFKGSDAKALATRGQATFSLIENSPVPVIAAVNGFALGGGMELALACDFIVASEKAKFGLPEVSLGIIPGYGGTQRLSRTIGRSKARMFALTGDMFNGQKAYELGVAAAVTSPEELLPMVQKLASTIASRAPMALKLVKEALNQGADVDQARGFALEADKFGQAFETNDSKEGVSAFIEKRPADFKGN